MKDKLDAAKNKLFNPRECSLDEFRQFMALFLGGNPNSGQGWDLICAQRGPDSPSERSDMAPGDSAKAYAGRRERKFRTVEVIRNASFFGVSGGCARSHKDTKVVLPPMKHWDHFDRHVQRAANILGLKVEINDELE